MTIYQHFSVYHIFAFTHIIYLCVIPTGFDSQLEMRSHSGDWKTTWKVPKKCVKMYSAVLWDLKWYFINNFWQIHLFG